MESLLSDLRLTLRQLIRQRGYTVAAVLTLGVALGATAAIFSVVSGVLLRPLPFPAPSELVTICERHPSVESFCIASPPDVEDWGAASTTLARVGIGRDWSFRISLGDRAEGVPGGLATAGFFGALGVRPALGRLPAPDEWGPRRVAVLSHGLWRTFAGEDSSIVGRTIAVDGEPVPVVGVLPASATVPALEYVRLWTSLPFDPRDEENRGWRGFKVIARLAPGATRQSAAAELNLIARGLAERYPETNRGWSVDVVGLHQSLVGNVRVRLLVFLGAVGLVLLLGCANLANLTLARATHRAPELALRAAIGATRTRLARLLLLESLIVALAGLGLGIPLASWGVDLFKGLAPAGIPRLDAVGMDWRVLLFAFGLTLLTALLIGGLPALHGARADLAPHLHSTRGARARGRGALVVAETAIAVMLLAGAALLGRAFARLTAWDPGFPPSSRLVAWTGVSPGTYPSVAAVRALYTQALEAVGTLPGVASVSLASAGPLFGGIETGTARAVAGAADSAVVRWHDVGPGYFTTLGLPLRAGRDFTAQDQAGAAPVAIVNQALARRLWPDRTPIGERLEMVRPDLIFTVVGVVADVPPFEPRQPAQPEVYWPFFQYTRWGAHVVVRAEGPAPGLPGAIAQRLREVSPELEPSRVSTLDELARRRLVSPRFNALLVGSFAGVALLLAVIGIAGMVAYRVSHRLREIGIRLALGATVGTVIAGFVREAGLLVLAGVGFGTVAALALTRLMRTMLAGTSPTDPAAFAAVTAGMLLVGLAAAWIPARRATRVAPHEALRSE
jgi:predicted permease